MFDLMVTMLGRSLEASAPTGSPALYRLPSHLPHVMLDVLYVSKAATIEVPHVLEALHNDDGAA